MEEIIDIYDIKTYPDKIVKFIISNDIEEFPEIQEDFRDYLNKLYCNFYHYTRLKDKEFVLKNGLLRPAKSKLLKEYYVQTLEDIYTKEINFRNIIYNYDYEGNHRGMTVHVTTPVPSKTDDGGGVKNLLNYWGGELIEDMLKKAKLKNKLKEFNNIGNPYIIKIRVSLRELDKSSLERIIYIMNLFYKKGEKLGIDHTFYRDVKPNEIIQIIEGETLLKEINMKYK